MARAERALRLPDKPEGDRNRKVTLAARLAREPQIAALESVAAWAETQGVSPKSVDGMREIIAAFAAAANAPNLDLAMRARRLWIMRELRETVRRG